MICICVCAIHVCVYVYDTHRIKYCSTVASDMFVCMDVNHLGVWWVFVCVSNRLVRWSFGASMAFIMLQVSPYIYHIIPNKCVSVFTWPQGCSFGPSRWIWVALIQFVSYVWITSTDMGLTQCQSNHHHGELFHCAYFVYLCVVLISMRVLSYIILYYTLLHLSYIYII